MAKVRAARHYQPRNAPLRRIALLGSRNARGSLREALNALPGLLDLAKTRDLIRHGRARDVAHTAIDWHRFQQILRHPFERLARTYEAGAKLGERKINGAFAAKRRGVRYAKGGSRGGNAITLQGRNREESDVRAPGAESDVAEALRCLNRESSVASWTGLAMSPYGQEDLKQKFDAMSAIAKPVLLDARIADLRGSQITVRMEDGHTGGPIQGMRDAEGLIHVADGHHRIRAAILRNDKTIPAEVFDL